MHHFYFDFASAFELPVENALSVINTNHWMAISPKFESFIYAREEAPLVQLDTPCFYLVDFRQLMDRETDPTLPLVKVSRHVWRGLYLLYPCYRKALYGGSKDMFEGSVRHIARTHKWASEGCAQETLTLITEGG